MKHTSLESLLGCKEIQPVHPKGNQFEYSLEGLMLKLKLQYFGHLMWRTDSFEKTLMPERLKMGREGDGRRWAGWMASLTWWTWVWEAPGVGDGQGSLACCSPCGGKELDTTEWLNWTDCKFKISWRFILYLDKSFKFYITLHIMVLLG